MFDYRFSLMKGCMLGALLSSFLLSPALMAANRFYVKAGLGYGWTRSGEFKDINADSKNPPAYYGPGIGSKGDFGNPVLYNLALGYHFSPVFSGEVNFGYQSGYRFSGNANFIRSGASQPVDAKLNSMNLMLSGLINLSRLFHFHFYTLEPFVGGGIGVSQNNMEDSTFNIQVPQLTQWYNHIKWRKIN